MEQENRYFTDADHANLIYFQFPKLLMYGQAYKKMSSDSKLLYMLALDLVKLSMRNGWKDDKRRYYIKLSLETIQERMNCGKQKAQKLKKELENYNLLEEKRMGQGKANRLYILQLKYSEQDIIKANNDHEDIKNDEFGDSGNHGTLGAVGKDENHPSRSSGIIPLEGLKSSPIKNLSFKNDSFNVLDDEKRTSSPVHTDEELNVLISNFREETKEELSERSFKSVIRKVLDKYRQGKIEMSFRDYLATSLINKIEELDLRRAKDSAKTALQSNRKQKLTNHLNNFTVSDNLPFYDWLNED